MTGLNARAQEILRRNDRGATLSQRMAFIPINGTGIPPLSPLALPNLIGIVRGVRLKHLSPRNGRMG